MKNLKNILFNFLVILFITVAITLVPADLFKETKSVKKINPYNLTREDSLWINKTLSSLTLEEKCGQMIMPKAQIVDKRRSGYKRLIKLVKDYKIGGFIYLKGDLEKQIDLTNALQRAAEIPLLFSADYERGLGMRLEGTTEFPYNMGIGAVNNSILTFEMGKIVAEEARAIGVHINFAPLLDINTDYRNPIIDIRAYSANPDIVAQQSLAYLSGLKYGGLANTAKHFPGHGATDIDSHSQLPVINRSKSEMEENELVPFRHAINYGVNAVMTGHLEVPAYEKQDNLPATLSKNITTELLKNKLGFRGLVITDAMNMRAITNNYSNQEAAKLAVQAGNDILLFPKNVKETLEGLINAVNDGEISESRIDESVKKILALKRMLKLDKNKFVDKQRALKIVTKNEHKRLAKKLAEKSVTLIKDEQNLIPVDQKKYKKIICIGINDNKPKETPLFIKDLKKEIKKLKKYELHSKDRQRSFNRVLKAAKKADLIILPLYIYSFSLNKKPEHLKKLNIFLNKLLELNKPTIIISFGTPYLIVDLPGIQTYFCAYGQTDIVQSVMTDALFGRTKISGKLPVAIPGTNFNLGYGIEFNPEGIYVPEKTEDKSYNFTQVNKLMKTARDKNIFPGGVLLIGHQDKVIYHKAFGRHTYSNKSPKTKTSTMFDLASLSKVVGTTSAAMLLSDLQKMNLNDFVKNYLPEFANNGKDSVTIYQLLTHRSGLSASKPFYKSVKKADQVIDQIMNSKVVFKPGTSSRYSDLGMITLQKVIERITNSTLDSFLKENLFKKLGMTNTLYNPDKKQKKNCAPTEYDSYWRKKTIQGEVHDETASLLNGVAGHAGLFSTSSDLAKFAHVLVNNGLYGNKQIFSPVTIDEWTTQQYSNSSRGIGWDTKYGKFSSAGKLFSKNSFGHTGFTGTSLWIDKERKLFVILLTNRVHPSRHNKKIIRFRRDLHEAVIQALEEEN
ncbi:MAG: glycoside hydrolase family 3 N-terminal domain-containing protein [Rhodothermaceae bacterium]